jgi:hypothetical protein
MQIQQIIYLAGLAQIALALGSLAVPKVLNWQGQLTKVEPLIRQMFWVYAAYIFVINLCFGFLSIFAFRDITNASTLSIAVTGFIAVYWLSRVLIQFLYFDRSNFPTGKYHKLAEVVLVTVFVFLSITYSWAFYLNYNH